MRFACPASLLLLLMAPCHAVFADEAEDRQAIEAAVAAWTRAFNARDAGALAALTTHDVLLLDPHEPAAHGRTAQDRWQQAFAATNGKVTNTTKELVVAGDIAWRIGTITVKAGDGLVNRSQTLEIWQRTKGQWRLHRQMSSGILSRPTLLPGPPPPDPVLDQPKR